ncbi:SusC/RagA family TonB-linked outer membrane protein [Bacteroidia bacterium]|nr:SusC/RagA family TonB-linked outer membrane protein [Bacteroidia bacterium]
MKHKLRKFATRLLFVAAMHLAGGGVQGMYAESPQDVKIAVTGVVSDAAGPVIGAGVVEKGNSGNGVATDMDGKYSLRVSPNATLTVEYLGYTAQDVSVDGRTSINVTLVEDASTLDEVVVVGYGVQRKRDLTGSISQVKGDDVKNVPTGGLSGAMIGKVSGVDFITSSGAPGESPAMRIRGTGTFNGPDPLWVVDGIVGGMLANPNDVESVEILKDASASAIYGTRAANGVVLVTTKKGRKSEKMNINLNAYTGVSNLAKKIDLLEAPQLAMLRQEAYTINNSTDAAYKAFWDNPYFATQRTDWQDAYFGTGTISNVDLSIRGGNEKSTFYTSFGYYKDKGMISPASSERYNVLITSDHQLNKYLKIGQNFQYSGGRGQEQEGGVRDALRYSPAIPVRYDDGTFGSAQLYGGNEAYLGDVNNPLIKALNGDRHSNSTHRVQGFITIDLELLPGLVIKGNYGVNADFKKSLTFYTTWANQHTMRAEAGLTRSYEDNYRFLGETYATWFKEFDQHTVNLSGGYSAEQGEGESFSGERKGFADESENQVVLDNGQTVVGAGGNFKAKSSLSSWFGRAFYSYDNKYLLTVTGRADGSSKFYTGNRWGFFPAFSAGWRVTEEAFMKDVDFLSNLKLTGGWGSLGNQAISDFQYLTILSKSADDVKYNFGGTVSSGVGPAHLGNKAITWERTNMLNLALEAGFLKNRLNLTVSYFDKNTEGMLLSTLVVGTMGRVGIPPSNIGEVNNHGVELDFSYADRIAGDFTYSANLNLTFMQNKITKLYGGEWDKSNFIAGSTFGNGLLMIARTFAGDPMGSYYGHKTSGIYQNQTEIDTDPYLRNDVERKPRIQPGDVRFVDLNDDGKIDDKDRTNLGNPNPDAIIGFNGNLGYKGIDFSFNVTSNLGFEIYNATRMDGLSSNYAYNMYADQMNRLHDRSP